MTIDTTTRRAFLRTAGAAAVAMAGVLAVPSVPVLASQRPVELDPIAALATASLSALKAQGAGSDSGYRSQRRRLAEAAGARLAIDGGALDAAWEQADLEHQVALLTGMTQLGVPYRRYTSSPGVGFDCSGLTTFAWAAAGVRLARQSTAQIRRAVPRTFDTAQAGDLVHFPGHIMMWLGVERTVLHSPRTGRNVEIVKFQQTRGWRVGDPTGAAAAQRSSAGLSRDTF